MHPPTHSEPIAQSEPGPGHNLISVSAVDYVFKITVPRTIAIKSYFLRKTFDGILQSLNFRDVSIRTQTLHPTCFNHPVS